MKTQNSTRIEYKKRIEQIGYFVYVCVCVWAKGEHSRDVLRQLGDGVRSFTYS